MIVSALRHLINIQLHVKWGSISSVAIRALYLDSLSSTLNMYSLNVLLIHIEQTIITYTMFVSLSSYIIIGKNQVYTLKLNAPTVKPGNGSHPIVKSGQI